MLTASQTFAQPSLSSQVINQSDLRVLDINLALTFGINEAAFINRLKFWQARGYGTLHEGKRWIYNTYEQWVTKELPWLSRNQFKRLIKNLRDLGVLLVKKLKARQWHQVNHYTIDEEALNRLVTATTASVASDHSIGSLSTDDQYAFKTAFKTERETNNFEEKFNSEFEAKEEQGENGIPQPTASQNLSDEPLNPNGDQCSEPLENYSQLQAFHKELLRVLQFCDGINNPWAYAQKCVDNLRAGSPSSIELYEIWAETGKILLEDVLHQQEHSASEKGKKSASVQPNQKEATQSIHKEKKEEVNMNQLKEWEIHPDDEELLAEGYAVGDIYPEFVQWATPRLKYHPDLSDYAAKAHAIKKFKLEPQLALEMWRDFKRLLVREVEDKRKKEANGQRYFTPAWMQLPVDVPVSEARKASVELSEVKEAEQQAIEASRSHPPSLTAEEIEEAMIEAETFYSEDIEESEEEEEEELNPQILEPIELAEAAIELLKNYPSNPLAEHTATHFMGIAKEKATESELEAINQLIDSSGLDIW